MSAQGADENQEQGSTQDQDTEASEAQTGSGEKSDKTPDIEQLMKENAKHRARIRELKPLAEKWTEKQNAEKTEVQLLKEQIEAMQQESVQNLRRAIAADAGVPSKLAPLLSGTEEEMREQAKALAEEFSAKPSGQSQSRPTPMLRTGQTGAGNSKNDVNDWLRSLAGK